MDVVARWREGLAQERACLTSMRIGLTTCVWEILSRQSSAATLPMPSGQSVASRLFGESSIPTASPSAMNDRETIRPTAPFRSRRFLGERTVTTGNARRHRGTASAAFNARTASGRFVPLDHPRRRNSCAAKPVWLCNGQHGPQDHREDYRGIRPQDAELVVAQFARPHSEARCRPGSPAAGRTATAKAAARRTTLPKHVNVLEKNGRNVSMAVLGNSPTPMARTATPRSQ